MSLTVRTPAAEQVVRDAYDRDDPQALRDEIGFLAAQGVTDVKVYVAGLAAKPEEVEPALTWVSQALGLPGAEATGTEEQR